MSHDVPPAGEDPAIRTGGDRSIRFRALPLRLVVAGRFGLEPNRLHRLDADGAGGLLERGAPALAVRVADRLRSDGTSLSVELRFRHRKHFAPGAIAATVPDLAQIAAAHEAARGGADVADLRARLAGYSVLQDALGATDAPAATDDAPGTTPSAPSSGDDSIDRLLDMVETPGTRPSVGGDDPARAAVSGFIAEVTRASTRRPGAGNPPEILETALAKQIDEIMSHPDFVAMERAWAALRFLARRIDLRSAVAVDVLEADAETLADRLETLVPEDDPDGAGPVRLIVDLNDYDASDRDIARLRRLAAFAASRRAVLLGNAGSGFFGDQGADALSAMHDPETYFETGRYAGWRTLRDAPESAWLGLCLSRIALREAVDGRDDKVLRFARSRRIGQLLDAGAAPAVAALVAEAHAATGWACAIGSGGNATVENLVLAHDAASGFDGPVRPALTMNAADSAAAAGLVALVPERGRDTARLLRLPAVRHHASREERADGSLAGRLFQAQVVHGLQWNADRIFDTPDPGALRDRAEAYLAALLSTSGPNAGAEVRLDRDEDGEAVLAVHVRSGRQAAPGASMAFDIPLGAGAAPSDDDL